MANKRSNKKNQSRKNQSRRMRGGMRGGGSDFNVPIRAFYPQNTFAQDPSREMTTSLMKGGSGIKRKNHSRKYLKKRIAGGSGFFNNFGSLTGSQTAANQITGTTPLSILGQSYKV